LCDVCLDIIGSQQLDGDIYCHRDYLDKLLLKTVSKGVHLNALLSGLAYLASFVRSRSEQAPAGKYLIFTAKT